MHAIWLKVFARRTQMLVIHILQCFFSLTSFHLLAMWSNIRDDRMYVKYRDIITKYCPPLLLKRNLDISFSPKILGVGLLLYHSISWSQQKHLIHPVNHPFMHQPSIFSVVIYLLGHCCYCLYILTCLQQQQHWRWRAHQPTIALQRQRWRHQQRCICHCNYCTQAMTHGERNVSRCTSLHVYASLSCQWCYYCIICKTSLHKHIYTYMYISIHTHTLWQRVCVFLFVLCASHAYLLIITGRCQRQQRASSVPVPAAATTTTTIPQQ